MREIEVKARIASSEKIIKALQGSGVKVSEPVTQYDEVFGLAGASGEGDNTDPWLRIRTERKNDMETIIYTLKKSVSSQLDSIEHETTVEDADELRQIILHSGFEPYVTVNKTRRKAQIGDIEICIDQIENIGEFVEAEKLTDENADVDAVRDELWQLLETYSVTRSDELSDGYDTMVMQKAH